MIALPCGRTGGREIRLVNSQPPGNIEVMEARIFWSLLWRSVLLFPLGLAVGFAVIGFPFLAFALCWWALILMLGGHWFGSLAAFGAIVPLAGLRKWMARRLAGDGCWPDSLL